MTKNVGSIDKNVRIIAGTILLLAGIFADMAAGWRIGVLVVAAIAYTTAFVGF